MFKTRFIQGEELRTLGFAHVGKNVQVHETCNIVMPENISLGDGTRIDAFCSIIAAGKVSLGKFVHLAAHTIVSGGAGIEIDDFAAVSGHCAFYSESSDYRGIFLSTPLVPTPFFTPTRGKIVVGKHAIIGVGSVFLPGVQVGEGCSVGALSLVSCNLAPWGMYVGSPAKWVKERKKDLLKQEEAFWAYLRSS